MNRIMGCVAAAALLVGCQRQDSPAKTVDDGYQKVLIERLLNAKPGEVIDHFTGIFPDASRFRVEVSTQQQNALLFHNYRCYWNIPAAAR